MCRHLAYVGETRTLESLLVTPEHGLVRQSWQPRRQRYGTVNADGFGVGWYAPGVAGPARYRRDTPIWGDETFHDVARVTSSSAVLAAVRSATEGTAGGVEAVAPFSDGRHLFSHNGRIDGWPHRSGSLVSGLPAEALLDQVARTDSALLWQLVRHALAAGLDSAKALASVAEATVAAGPARVNLLLHDGHQIVATCAGDTLFYRHEPSGVVVASEPTDDLPGWVEVPDASLVVAEPAGVQVAPLTGVAL